MFAEDHTKVRTLKLGRVVRSGVAAERTGVSPGQKSM